MMYDVWCMAYDVCCIMYDVKWWCMKMMYDDDVWWSMYEVYCMMSDVWCNFTMYNAVDEDDAAEW